MCHEGQTLDYESPALTAELQAHHALTREHLTFNIQRPIFDWSRVLRRDFGLPAAALNLDPWIPREFGELWNCRKTFEHLFHGEDAARTLRLTSRQNR